MNISRVGASSLLAVLMAIGPAFQAAAHSTVQSSTPPSGATLEQSPPLIEIKFHAAITNPQLATGHNEVRWKGLSKDGHVVNGTLVYEIKPKEAKAS
jgi:methionine-rich copper-binding protein CopC